MKFAIELLILFLLPATYISGDNLKQYCNNRFNFCVEYPEQFFTDFTISDNDDGIEMKGSENDLRLTVSGSHNVLDWSFRDLYEMELDDLALQYDNLSQTGSNFTDYYYDLEMKSENKNIYIKTYNFDGILVTMKIFSGKSIPEETYEALKKEVIITQNVQ